MLNRKLIALLLAGFFILASCDNDTASENEEELTAEELDFVMEDEPSATTTTAKATTTAETTTTAVPRELKPEQHDFVNSEAEELYNIILENKPVWERENMSGGTLLDLDFDRVPEFLVFYGEKFSDYDCLVGVYRINDDNSMNLITDLISNFTTGAETMNRAISLYTDENGNKSWALPYQLLHNDGKKEYRMALYDFTGGTVTERVKFLEVYTDFDYNYDNYDYDEYTKKYNEWQDSIIYYIDDEVLTRTDEEIQAYAVEYARYEAELAWYERDYDDFIANSEKEFYKEEGMLSEGVYPPDYFDFMLTFPFYTSVNDKFYKLKRRFEESLIPTAYKIDASLGWNGTSYIDWKSNNDIFISKSVANLTNAYASKDTDYLMDRGAYSMGAMAKPVIYLYPEEVTDIEVRVTFPNGQFTCTYPDYGNGWKVTAHPDGTLINHADGREYSYLYWEGESITSWDFSRGFVVKGSDTAKFLQEKLAYLGMKPREYNEFIVYWLPLMQNNEYNLITFQTTKYEESALLHITPKPDSILRVFMAYMPLEKPVNIPEQKLENFTRSGFSVIEWGGTIIN